MDFDSLHGKRILLIGKNSFEISKICLEFLFEGIKYQNKDVTEPQKFTNFFKIKRKTTLSGERGIYFSTNLTIDELINICENFHSFDKELIKKGYINFIDLDILRKGFLPYAPRLQDEIDILKDIVRSLTKKFDRCRIVINSISGLFRIYSDLNFIEKMIDDLGKSFDEIDSKILVTSCKSDNLLVSYENFNNLLVNKLRIDVVKEVNL